MQAIATSGLREVFVNNWRNSADRELIKSIIARLKFLYSCKEGTVMWHLFIASGGAVCKE